MKNRPARVNGAILALILSASVPACAQSMKETTGNVTPATPPSTETVETRIQSLHDKLKITAPEESQWSRVAAVMKDNAETARADFQQRQDDEDSMSAIDDIKSYQKITQARADGLQKLADAFAPLYDAMPDDQKKIADKVFGHMHHGKTPQ